MSYRSFPPAAIQTAADMTLRDYFAAQVLPRLIPDRVYSCADVAKEAYQMADAMLAEREK